jgi:hypothetical protein
MHPETEQKETEILSAPDSSPAPPLQAAISVSHEDRKYPAVETAKGTATAMATIFAIACAGPLWGIVAGRVPHWNWFWLPIVSLFFAIAWFHYWQRRQQFCKALWTLKHIDPVELLVVLMPKQAKHIGVQAIVSMPNRSREIYTLYAYADAESATAVEVDSPKSAPLPVFIDPRSRKCVAVKIESKIYLLRMSTWFEISPEARAIQRGLILNDRKTEDPN